jgi:hypothetical protein
MVSPWKLLSSNDGSGCILHNASIRWANGSNGYHATGTAEIQHVAQVPGLVRILIDGTTVIWENGKQRGPPIKSFIYLPTDGGPWTVSTGRKRSSNRPDFKVFVVAVHFPPNDDGIRFFQVCVEVIGNTGTSDGERFAEALTYANTSIERSLVATNSSYNDTTI